MADSPTDSAPAPIELRDVQIRHPDIVGTWRVNGVNWRIEQGDYWAVGGLHWSGKTNLLLTVAGVNPRIRGDLRLFGGELGGMDAEEALRERLRIGLVFGGDGRLLPDLSVAENIALPLRYLRGVDDKEMETRVRRVMDELGLLETASQPAGSVDLARRRRTALARAVILEPEVLLFDQPLGGLDPRQRDWWRDLIDEFHAGHALLDARPATIVVATEDLRPWRDRADRFALLDEGRLHVVGDREAMMRFDHTLARELHL